MNTYTLMSGETIEYPDPPPAVADHLARVHAAAADPAADVNRMIELVYGDQNPILDRTLIPGRPMVTKAVFENPLYRVMADQIGVKRVQLGLLDPVATEAAYCIPVKDAARQLGITETAVRAAIAARKLAAHLRNGQWYTRAESVASYKVSTRGRKRAAEPVRGRVGSEPGYSLAVRVEGGEFVTEDKAGHQVSGHFSPGWTRAVVKTTANKSVRAFVIEPAPGEAGEVSVGGLYVRGPFKVVRKANSPARVKEAWAATA